MISSTVYQTFYSAWNLLFWCCIPTGCMIVFGALTIRNVHHGRRTVAPQVVQRDAQRRQRKTDRQLIQMMLAQSFVFGSTTLAYSIGSLYVSPAGVIPVTDPVERAIYTNILNMLTYIALAGPCASFYLFTLSSQLFRKELLILIR